MGTEVSPLTKRSDPAVKFTNRGGDFRPFPVFKVKRCGYFSGTKIETCIHSKCKMSVNPQHRLLRRTHTQSKIANNINGMFGSNFFSPEIRGGKNEKNISVALKIKRIRILCRLG